MGATIRAAAAEHDGTRVRLSLGASEEAVLAGEEMDRSSPWRHSRDDARRLPPCDQGGGCATARARDIRRPMDPRATGPRFAPSPVFTGLLLGVACGLFFGELVRPLEFVANAFIRLL